MASHGPSERPIDARCSILVVEDDRTIAGNLVEYLEHLGQRVDVAYDGTAAIARIGGETFDVIVLDIGLPRIDGLAVLAHLRDRLGSTTPVLLLTARDELASKAAGFRAGADDYLTKPFALAEVAMRISALHRRATGEVASQVLRAGSLRLDRRTWELDVGGQPLKLTPKSLRLLEHLMRDPGRMVTRAELEAALWPDDPRRSDTLRSQIHILRRALAQAGFHGLETVHGVGYRIRCETPGNN